MENEEKEQKNNLTQVDLLQARILSEFTELDSVIKNLQGASKLAIATLEAVMNDVEAPADARVKAATNLLTALEKMTGQKHNAKMTTFLAALKLEELKKNADGLQKSLDNTTSHLSKLNFSEVREV